MEAFRHLDSVAVPLPQPNIDTDRIIPARFLSRPREVDHGQFLFHDARLAAGRHAEPGLPAEPAGVADGADRRRRPQLRLRSSRESAVWALFDAGFRCAIAPSFGDIFRSNGTKNGLLPVVLPAEAVESIIVQLRRSRCACRGRPAPADGDRARRHGPSLRDRSLRQALPAAGPRRFRPDRDLRGRDRRLRTPLRAGEYAVRSSDDRSGARRAGLNRPASPEVTQ